MYHLCLSVLLLLFVTPSNGASVNSTLTKKNCTSFECGSTKISYPFWLDDGTNSYCGFPSFGLTCTKDQKAVLHLPEDDFNVEDINYNESILTVVDADVADGTCPRVRKNVTLDLYKQLAFAPVDLYLRFFFNCSFVDQELLLSSSPSCFTQGTNRSFVYFEGEYPTTIDWFSKCRDTVVAPVLGGEYKSSLISSFENLLQSGFQLYGTTALDCKACENSDGYCGYRDSSTFVCFCDDGFHEKTCNDRGQSKSKKSKATIIGGSVAGAVIGILALFSILFFCYRRKRHVAASSVLLTRNISRDGSSNYDIERSSRNNSMRDLTHVFSYKELEEATNNFDESRELGDGGFGTVYYGKLKDGRAVAVKRLYENNYKRVEQFMNEVKILSSLRHQNLVSLYGCTSRHSRELLLVYEFIPNGTVADHLHGDRAEGGGLTWPVRLSIAVETSEALAYLHAIDPPIIHRDVKTNNILLDNNFRVKVADFGLSRLFPLDVTHVSTTLQGTPGYVDPDYHKCYQLTDKSDVYSFGVVLAELISSKPAVDIGRHRHDINLATMASNRIQGGALGEFVDPTLGYQSDYKVSESITWMAELTFSCLREEKDDRPSMEEVVKELKRIERRTREVVSGTEEMDNLSDDVVLLKNIPPRSPDSVINPWASKSTTPNTSS